MNILFISTWFPYPKDNGSKIRIYNLLRGLSKQHRIMLISFSDDPVDQAQIEHLKCFCQVEEIVSSKRYNPAGLRALFGFISSMPRSLFDTYSQEMFHAIRRVISSQKIDLVIASQWNTAIYWKAFQGTPAIFDEVEIGIFEGWLKQSPTIVHRLRHKITLLKQGVYLNELLSQYNACTVVSENELHLVKDSRPGSCAIEVIPNSIDLSEYSQISEDRSPYELIFTGSFRYSANYKAIQWFLSDIYPKIKEKVKEINLTITGDHMGLPIPLAEDVTLTGSIPDIHNRIARARISIVPLLEGGGTRLKILEAMALNTPVVSTSKGAEGLEVENGKHLLIADTPEDFTEAVIRLLSEDKLRRTLTRQARSLVEEKYNSEAVINRYLEVVEQFEN